MDRAIATFTLDYGKCPKWLFDRMVSLSKEVLHLMSYEYGPDEFIKRIADPVWFQSLGTVLAFDWNASGLTTVLTAALKEAIKGEEKQLGIFICGGKGKTSRKTPTEIQYWSNKLDFDSRTSQALVYNSKMAAKVDSSLVQDNYQIYHHSFFFSANGSWAVVQQGMNTKNLTARRYHWYSENLSDLINEPHSGIMSQLKEKNVLDLTSAKSSKNREVSLELLQNGFKSLSKDIRIIREHYTSQSGVLALKFKNENFTSLKLQDNSYDFHYLPVVEENFFESPYLKKILEKICYENPQDYENFLAQKGVGPKTVRALSLVSEVIYGAKPSYEDPARYSFAFGGKDAVPYPVDRSTYDESLTLIKKAVEKFDKIN